MSQPLIIPLQRYRMAQNDGSKGKQLRFLSEAGFKVPTTYVCSPQAYRRYLSGDATVIDQLRFELTELLDPQLPYAVRSSASLEDGREHSFAGQFKSVLDVKGIEPILQSINTVWASSRSPQLESYLQKSGLDPEDLEMTVLIQAMVSPLFAGVAFSKNPMTGRDEIIVEAVLGSGEALVQEGVTPEHWVDKWGKWIEQPADGQAPESLIRRVADETRQIAQRYPGEVDLEWVYDGHELYWVQLREITTLNNVNIYSNRISKEVLPGIIKPLIWSVNVPLVNASWVKLISELIGPNDIDPLSLSKSFYYRAYFNMGTFGRIFELLGLPKESLEMLLGDKPGGDQRPRFRPGLQTLRHIPRMLAFSMDKLRFHRKIKPFLSRMRTHYASFDLPAAKTLSEKDLLEHIDRLYALNQESAYYNIVVPLMMQSYGRLLQRRMQKHAVDYAGFNLTKGEPEALAYDPAAGLAALYSEYQTLADDCRLALQAQGIAALQEEPELTEFHGHFDEFLTRFGHLSDSGNDFSVPPWRETPEFVLQWVIAYQPPETAGQAKISYDDLPSGLTRSPLFRWLYHRAQKYQLYREAVSSLYTYGYGLFRVYFLALADRLVHRGLLDDQEDVFYLSFEEVRRLAAGLEPAEACRVRVTERRAEIEASRTIEPPGIIYGEQPIPLEADNGSVLEGVATSRGYYQGPVTVVQGMQDFAKLRKGDVLVIPFSDVSWTPLFAKAGAVIAESGGMLSHSSIIAREYQIPNVVSVPGACRLKDGMRVTVDGYQGKVLIHEA